MGPIYHQILYTKRSKGAQARWWFAGPQVILKIHRHVSGWSNENAVDWQTWFKTPPTKTRLCTSLLYCIANGKPYAWSLQVLLFPIAIMLLCRGINSLPEWIVCLKTINACQEGLSHTQEFKPRHATSWYEL